MSAKLVGEDFEIEPPDDERRVLGSDRPAEWSWTIRPISSGTKELRLELSVLLDENSNTPIVVKRYVELIRVQVHPWYTSKRMAKDALAVLGALGLSAVAVAAPARSWWRRRQETRRQSTPVSMTEDNRRQVVAVADHLDSLLKSGLLGLDEQRTVEAQTVILDLRKAAAQPSVPREIIRQHLKKAATVAVAGTGTSTSVGQGLVALVNQTLQNLGLS